MAKNVFISFRYDDGHEYKDELASLFDDSNDTVDFSEDEDRSQMNEDSIKQFLYKKLKRSSVTIVLLTPAAINYKKKVKYNPNLLKFEAYYDDWIYDEVRYSLENREGNATNGLVAVYVPEVESQLFQKRIHKCSVCNRESEVLCVMDFDNLVRKNVMNIKADYKRNQCPGIYDLEHDSYCSLISYNDFKRNFGDYIDMAYKKRSELYKYDLCKRLK